MLKVVYTTMIIVLAIMFFINAHGTSIPSNNGSLVQYSQQIPYQSANPINFGK